MFVKRLISGIVLIFGLGFSFAYGGYLLSAVLMIISLIGYCELVKALCSETERRELNGPDNIAFASIILYYLSVTFTDDKTFLILVIGGFMLYARGVTTRSRSTFYSIAACSAAGLLVFQAALNIFGVTDILPLTGVTLPFVSYGGTSMAACWGLLAFIKAADERTYVHRHKKIKKIKKMKNNRPSPAPAEEEEEEDEVLISAVS